MGTKQWTDTAIEGIVTLKLQGLTNVAIADQFKVGESTIRRLLKKHKHVMDDPEGYGIVPSVESDPLDPSSNPPIGQFDAAIQTINNFIGWHAYTPSDPPECEIKDQYERILVLNDLHAPYHDDPKLQWILNTYRGKVDMCAVAGDLSDLYSYSRYPKRKQRFTAVQEMVSTATILVQLAEAFPKVVLMSGNHDERLRKHIVARGIQGDELEAMLYLNSDFCNPMAALVQKHGIKNVETIPLITDKYAEWNWIWQHGDLILGHPERYSKIPNKVVGDFIDYLMRFRTTLHLKEFRVVGSGHTHQAGFTWNDFGVVGFEMGCLAETPEYASDPKLTGARPAIKGYTIFYQDRATGRTNVNLSRFYELSD